MSATATGATGRAGRRDGTGGDGPAARALVAPVRQEVTA